MALEVCTNRLPSQVQSSSDQQSPTPRPYCPDDTTPSLKSTPEVVTSTGRAAGAAASITQ